jgi:hypothetical protein
MPALDTIILGKAKTAPDGKFFLKANKGNFVLNIKSKEGETVKTLGTIDVKIGKEGVYNKDLLV